MEKRNEIITAILIGLSTIALIFCVVLVMKNYSSNSKGKIKIEFVDLDESVIKEKLVEFKEEDTLEELITNNFDNVVFEDGMLLNIEDYVTPSDWSTFLLVYVDGKMSEVGISQIVFEDGTVISLRITVYG